MSGGTADVVSAKGDDVSRERASGVQDLSSEMSRQIASTSGAAHAAASGDGRRKSHSSVCRWTLPDFTKTRARQVWSDFQTVGGRECRLLVYPKGDSMALPGYISAYLQVDASRESADAPGAWSTKTAAGEGVFLVCYERGVVRPRDASNEASDAVPEAGARRDSWHRFSSRKKSHGWCDFARSAVVLDPKNGYLVDDALVVVARIVFLNESSELVVDAAASRGGAAPSPGEASRKTDRSPPVNLTGRFTWTIENLRHFAVMIKTQKVMSPSFVVGDCAFRLSAYQSAAGAEKKTEGKTTPTPTPTTGSSPSASLCAWRARRSTRSAATRWGRSRRARRRSARAREGTAARGREFRKWRATCLPGPVRASPPAVRAGSCSAFPLCTRRTARRAYTATRTGVSPATRSAATRRAWAGTISCPWRRSRAETTWKFSHPVPPRNKYT